MANATQYRIWASHVNDNLVKLDKAGEKRIGKVWDSKDDQDKIAYDTRTKFEKQWERYDKDYGKFKNKVIDEFKEYAKYYKLQAVFADSLIYIATTPILYYLVVNNRNDTNVFINIVSLYLIGYFMYQKPVIKM